MTHYKYKKQYSEVMSTLLDFPSNRDEMRERASKFILEHKNDHSEVSHKQLFWRDFFGIFGVNPNRVGLMESSVVKLNKKKGSADYLWKGMLLIEHKSKGADLDHAFQQALDYIVPLPESEYPRYVIVSDFQRIRLKDLKEGVTTEFRLEELIDNIELFDFILKREPIKRGVPELVDIKAAEAMAKLHDVLKENRYTGHDLEKYLVRLVFCMFADNTGIFEEKGQFYDLIQSTKSDGSDLGCQLGFLFQALNTPEEERMLNIPDDLNRFKFVNGKLFEDLIPAPHFNKKMRDILKVCSQLNWGGISPAIFGSLFQGVMDPQERRELGAHYTSEENIMKLINPLFLDGLKEEFQAVRGNRKNLEKFWDKLASIKILDPACGCGNFLVIAYRELRLLELEVMEAYYGEQTTIQLASRIDVDQFYGMEIEVFPCEVARVAMWLMDHLMCLKMRDRFGIYRPRIPLKARANIYNVNSLTTDWATLADPKEITYIIGNPPFVGSKFQNERQRKEMASLFPVGAKILDYVAAWYLKAADYMSANTNIITGFVSTNSITQGEQVEPLWKIMFGKGVKIHFAYRTFKWSNEARGNAAVHCVIIGFGIGDAKRQPIIYEHADDPEDKITSYKVKRINAYLVDAPDILLKNRSTPLSDVPEMGIGNKPIDDGNYLFNEDEKEEFLRIEPTAAKYMRPWIGSREFINGIPRYCLWLGDCPPDELKKMPECEKRIKAVEKFRLNSKSAPTVELSKRPRRFHVENMPTSDYIVVPQVSSERRDYVPIGFVSPSVLSSNLLLLMPDATLYHFGVLTSNIHMAWMRAVCGRLEMRYRYSAGIVYNNFPWPDATDKQKESIEKAAQAVLDIRSKPEYSGCSFADLYGKYSMPDELLKAHTKLDREVEKAYSAKKFKDDAERVAFLFSRYEKLIGNSG